MTIKKWHGWLMIGIGSILVGYGIIGIVLTFLN